jgi:formylglycine-generating enzyme required for sulfatase activity
MECAGGVFRLGATPDNGFAFDNEKWSHPLMLEPFRIARRPVTYGEYRKFAEPPYCKDGMLRRFDKWIPIPDDEPVRHVSWHQANAYCSFAGRRLPSEAEWEYAARGGRDGSKYPWGATISREDANHIGIGGRDDWDITAPVGSFPPNGFGLFDMAGNVWEWVEDDYHESFHGAPADGSAWEGGGRGFLRGGSWFCLPKYLRTSNRNLVAPGLRRAMDGFRCVRDVAP